MYFHSNPLLVVCECVCVGGVWVCWKARRGWGGVGRMYVLYLWGCWMVDGRLMGDVGGRREYPSQGRRTLSPHWCSWNHFHFKSTTEDVIVGQLSVQRSNLTPLTAYSPCSPLRHQHPATTIRRKDSRFNNIAQLPRFPRTGIGFRPPTLQLPHAKQELKNGSSARDFPRCDKIHMSRTEDSQ